MHFLIKFTSLATLLFASAYCLKILVESYYLNLTVAEEYYPKLTYGKCLSIFLIFGLFVKFAVEIAKF